MSSRAELLAPPESFYDDLEARKYTSSRIIEIQAKVSERALELLALPDDGVPRLLLDIGCGSGLSGGTRQWIGLDISQSMLDIAYEWDVEGGLLLGDMGQPFVVKLLMAPSVSLLFRAFFGPLYRCLARGARAVLQLYPENKEQRELIVGYAMPSGFFGCVVVDYPHSTKSRKEYLVLICGQGSITTPNAIVEDEESCSDGEINEDQENQSVRFSDRNRPRKKQKVTEKRKGREWILRKKEQMVSEGNIVPPDTNTLVESERLAFDSDVKSRYGCSSLYIDKHLPGEAMIEVTGSLWRRDIE